MGSRLRARRCASATVSNHSLVLAIPAPSPGCPVRRNLAFRHPVPKVADVGSGRSDGQVLPDRAGRPDHRAVWSGRLAAADLTAGVIAECGTWAPGWRSCPRNVGAWALASARDRERVISATHERS
ncbi:hypothetical protein PSU4_59940 [Pseudonocardia sulfidoxydans NBRC 16205]|uniref:Uncharacterized protein n=1 Tax=Pseudonocardia sulfidoxydans NBRC 16205 TaxID=1223511 RepID=A0A511DQD7_9PSEU|nr:hypothetical protein PSU4_59940 [Pseudonocardia sulfidoxydans NBRC 16205]